jgi:hypothetical protein
MKKILISKTFAIFFSTFLFFLFTFVPKATKIIEKKQVFMDEY